MSRRTGSSVRRGLSLAAAYPPPAPGLGVPLGTEGTQGPTATRWKDSLLTKDTHRRVYAAALLSPGSTTEIADQAGVDARTSGQTLAELAQAGLMRKDANRWTVDVERVSLAINPEQAVPLVRPIPRRREKRLAFLREAADLFRPDADYPESEVNSILRQLNPDFAAVRRYLVEERLMERNGGVYRRSGS
jgi:hypothetical protein